MGNRGHVDKQVRARELRALSWTLAEIAEELNCSKSSASLWTRGVEFTPKPRNRGHPSHQPHPLHVRKLAEIEECRRWAAAEVGSMSDRDLFMAGIGLYAGDGSKGEGRVTFSNSNPALVSLFCRWFRRFFDIDESRLRARVYLHLGLDIEAAERAWSEVLQIPRSQFYAAHRPAAAVSVRHNKHEFGCAHVIYGCSRTMRKVQGLLDTLVS